MQPDILRALGYLALGSRLKRLGERLQSQTQDLLAEAGIDVPAAQFPALAALHRLGPLAVGELATAIGVAQPGVTRIIGALTERGLVASSSGEDQRVRMIALTAAGRRLIARARRAAFPAIEAAVKDACAGVSPPLPGALTEIENALEVAPLSARARTPKRRRA